MLLNEPLADYLGDLLEFGGDIPYLSFKLWFMSPELLQGN
jgi:hypothetical protein